MMYTHHQFCSNAINNQLIIYENIFLRHSKFLQLSRIKHAINIKVNIFFKLFISVKYFLFNKIIYTQVLLKGLLKENFVTVKILRLEINSIAPTKTLRVKKCSNWKIIPQLKPICRRIKNRVQ